ncbi:hypothetical protein MT325_m805L [Paramecium bursaria chlorella virus MT325]|uniref:Uncharacterized protein m805L n=1 Tax=Paramecium bursaria Chlorella virus MT325 TaxID=346932 RepID=A7IVI5_PBCVM|nr:hypothetical protein MT325_m805L [Paramecium bursaria chlorella virus MT325]
MQFCMCLPRTRRQDAFPRMVPTQPLQRASLTKLEIPYAFKTRLFTLVAALRVVGWRSVLLPKASYSAMECLMRAQQQEILPTRHPLLFGQFSQHQRKKQMQKRKPGL